MCNFVRVFVYQFFLHIPPCQNSEPTVNCTSPFQVLMPFRHWIKMVPKTWQILLYLQPDKITKAIDLSDPLIHFNQFLYKFSNRPVLLQCLGRDRPVPVLLQCLGRNRPVLLQCLGRDRPVLLQCLGRD